MISSLKRRSVAFGAALGLLLSAPALAADTLLVNGRIFTANPAAPGAEAIALRDGTILAVGSRADVEKTLEPGYATEDLGGKMLLPGLIDSHVHAVFAGFTLVAAELPPGDTSVERLAEFAATSMKSGRGMIGDTLRIGNLTSAYWDDVAALDKVFNAPPFADTPVILAGSDAHTGWANKVLLQRAGVTTDFITGLSEAERKYFGHAPDFTPNGFSADTGWDKVMGAVPPVSQQTMVEAARSAVKVMNSNGVTAWLDPISNGRPAAPLFDMVPTKDDLGVLPAYKALSDAGELTAHVTGMVLLNSKSGPEALEVYDALAAKFPKTPDLMVGGIKILADGVIEYPAQTASLSLPYKNLGTPGPEVIGTDKFKALVTAADKRGALVHIHAIGDRAATDALDAIEAARKANGNSGIPHTITHLEVVKPEDRSRFKALGVIASMQLLWSGADEYTTDLVKPYLDESLSKTLYPARSLADAGAIVAGASDWPVTSPNPFLAMTVAITRQGTKGVLNPEEAMTAEQMLYAYTRNAAEAVRRADRIGSIEPGKAADLVLVDRDLLTVAPAEIADTKVLWTMFGGKKVFQAER